MVDESAPDSDCENFCFVKSNIKARYFCVCVGTVLHCMYTKLVLEKITLIPDTFKYSRNGFYFQNMSLQNIYFQNIS